jgi:hypothetical protein
VATAETAPATDTTAEPVVGPLAQATIAATAVGGAVIHFAMFPDHYQESDLLGLGFALAGWFQLALAVAIVARPSRRVLVAGIVGSLAIMVGWAVSRTVGLPLSGAAGDVEDATTIDLLSVAFEAVTVLACAAALPRRSASPRSPRVPRVAAMGIPVLAVAVITTTALASPEAADHHANDGADSHAHEEAAADDHAHEESAVDSAEHADHEDADHEGVEHEDAGHEDMAHDEPVPYDPNLPIDLSGTPGVTPEQQAEAENIIAVTLAGLPQWADPAVAEAAGFRSIGDGLTGVEHFVNQEFMDNPTIFDPDEPESLVYAVENGQRRLVAAMYMLETGTPLEDTPDIGGGLIQWHIHDNLCFSPNGQVAGLTRGDGTCAEGLVKPPNTPMVHVWIEPHPCGPFAALEGIGAGQIAEGEERLCDTAHGSH